MTLYIYNGCYSVVIFLLPKRPVAAMWLWIPILYVSVNKYPVTCVREACRSNGPGIAIVMPVVLKTSPLRMATKRYLSSV